MKTAGTHRLNRVIKKAKYALGCQMRHRTRNRKNVTRGNHGPPHSSMISAMALASSPAMMRMFFRPSRTTCTTWESFTDSSLQKGGITFCSTRNSTYTKPHIPHPYLITTRAHGYKWGTRLVKAVQHQRHIVSSFKNGDRYELVRLTFDLLLWNRVLTHFDHFQDFSITLNQISMTKLKSQYKHEQFWKCCVLRAYAGLYFERLSLKKHLNYSKLGVNEHVIITNVHDFSKTFMIQVFSMTFPSLEMTIFKFQDFSRFSMNVRTLMEYDTTCYIGVFCRLNKNKLAVDEFKRAPKYSSPGLSSHWWWGCWWPTPPPSVSQSHPAERQAVTETCTSTVFTKAAQRRRSTPRLNSVFEAFLQELFCFSGSKTWKRVNATKYSQMMRLRTIDIKNGEDKASGICSPFFHRAQTLASWWIIMGISPASITAWTCCWFPAVMLERNQTASCKQMNQKSSEPAPYLSHTQIIFQVAFFFFIGRINMEYRSMSYCYFLIRFVTPVLSSNSIRLLHLTVDIICLHLHYY